MFVTLPLAFGSCLWAPIRHGILRFGELCSHYLNHLVNRTRDCLLVEEYNAKRSRVAVSLGVFCWLLGLGTVFSFNIWADVKPLFGLNFFEIVDQLSEHHAAPRRILIAFSVWVLPQNIVREQLQVRSDRIMLVWRVVGGVIAPLGRAHYSLYLITTLHGLTRWLG